MRTRRWKLLASALVAVAKLGAQMSVTPKIAPTPAGQLILVNNGPGSHTDPHVSADLVCYTSQINFNSTVHYYNLATGVDESIPNDGTMFDFLCDVSGSTVVFTRITPDKGAIYTFDTSVGGAPVEVAPQAGSERQSPTIGDRTIVWKDFSCPTCGTSEPSTGLAAYDRATGITQFIAPADAQTFDQFPKLSEDGTVVVWMRCHVGGNQCVLWQAFNCCGTWVANALNTAAPLEGAPDTDGHIVAYSSFVLVSPNQESLPLYWQPVGGGLEETLSPPLNPAPVVTTVSVSNGWMAFSQLIPGATTRELYLYDVKNNILHQVTQDIGLLVGIDKTLNDISVTNDGKLRVVVQVGGANAQVYAYTFKLFAGTPGQADCYGQSVSALGQQFGGLDAAAAALGFSSVAALQAAIVSFCQ